MNNKFNILCCILAFFSPFCFGENDDGNEYRETVRKFFEVLFENNSTTFSDMDAIYLCSIYEEEDRNQKFKFPNTMSSNSVFLDSIKRYNSELTQGLCFDSISTLINKSMIFNEGEPFSNILELKFPNERSCFFEINNDAPKTIQFIWLPTGEDLKGKMLHYDKVEKYLSPGIISDIDGSTNIRENASVKSKIVGRVDKDEIFFYCPNSNSNWWAVYRGDNCFDKPIGYIFKNRICTYDKFPKVLKDKVDKMRSGC